MFWLIVGLLVSQPTDTAVRGMIEFRNAFLDEEEKKRIGEIRRIASVTEADEEIEKIKRQLADLEATQAKLDEARKKRPNTMTSKKREDERKANIIKFKEQITALRETAKEQRAEDEERYRDEVSAVKEEIADLRADPTFFPAKSIDLQNLAVGQVGIPNGPIVEISDPFKARDAQTLMNRIENGVELGPREVAFAESLGGKAALSSGVNLKIFQVIDDMNALVMANIVGNTPANWKIVWLSGIKTDGMVDDEFASVSDLLEVVGTKKYESKGGLKTVFILKPFDIERLKPYILEK